MAPPLHANHDNMGSLRAYETLSQKVVSKMGVLKFRKGLSSVFVLSTDPPQGIHLALQI